MGLKPSSEARSEPHELLEEVKDTDVEDSFVNKHQLYSAFLRGDAVQGKLFIIGLLLLPLVKDEKLSDERAIILALKLAFLCDVRSGDEGKDSDDDGGDDDSDSSHASVELTADQRKLRDKKRELKKLQREEEKLSSKSAQAGGGDAEAALAQIEAAIQAEEQRSGALDAQYLALRTEVIQAKEKLKDVKNRRRQLEREVAALESRAQLTAGHRKAAAHRVKEANCSMRQTRQ